MSYFITIIVTIVLWELLKYYVAYLYKCSKECITEWVESTETYKRYKATHKDDDVLR